MPHAQDVVDRVSFELSYRRDPTRRFVATGISGGEIDNAHAPGQTISGAFSFDYSVPPADWDWIRGFFRAAITDAVHEALEWFKVDGMPLLDPHGTQTDADALTVACNEFADSLYAMSHPTEGG